MTNRAVRVAVVFAGDGRQCYPRLDECPALEIVAELRDIPDLIGAPSHEHRAAIVGCTSTQLADDHFQTQLARLARSVPTVLVVPRVTRGAATVAARARACGLAARGDRPEDLARTVRTVARGRIAYPSEALAMILRLLPPVTPRRAYLAPS